MKKNKLSAFGISLVLALVIFSALNGVSFATSHKTGEIYLYGENHGVERILIKEVELWGEYYVNRNMRHLFVELPYYTAEFLNLWMQSESDDILDQVYRDWEGTAGYNPYIRQFYKAIKEKYPETVFHGTDVGHQYHTTGQRFLAYLETKGLEGSEKYALTLEAIEQGKHYYRYSDDAYRENKMAENFTREFDKLSGQSIMGIYGGAHTNPEALDYMTNTVPSMANRLIQYYPDLYTQNLALKTDPFRIDTFTIDGRDYTSLYFGREDLTGFKSFAYREFWRLEGAYESCKTNSKTGDVLPYNNYPMSIEVGQVFRIDYTMIDGSAMTLYYRSDGGVWNGLSVTEGFIWE